MKVLAFDRKQRRRSINAYPALLCIHKAVSHTSDARKLEKSDFWKLSLIAQVWKAMAGVELMQCGTHKFSGLSNIR